MQDLTKFGMSEEVIPKVDLMYLYGIMFHPRDDVTRARIEQAFVAGTVATAISEAKEAFETVRVDADVALSLADAPKLHSELYGALEGAGFAGAVSGMILGWIVFRHERPNTRASASLRGAFRMVEKACVKGRIEVAPVSWTPDYLGSRSPRWARQEQPTRLSSAARWLSGCAPAGRRRSWRVSSNRRHSRSGTGWPSVSVTPAGATAAWRQQSARNSIDCGVRTASSGSSGRSCQRRPPGSLGRRTRSHARVPVRERSPGGLSDCPHVSAAGCLPQWLLCVDEAAAVAACGDGCGVDRRNPCGACGLARHLRCAAHPCRVDGQGNARRPQARRSADVADWPCRCEPTQVRYHHGQERQPSGTGPGGTRLHRVSARSAVGGGYHVCPDLGGFSLSRGGARRLQPPHRWLVDGHHARHTTGARCSEHGAHDTATQGRDPPLRPGFAAWAQMVVATLRRRSCDDGAQAAFGSVWSGAIVLTRSPGGGRTGSAAAVLGCDCGRYGE